MTPTDQRVATPDAFPGPPIPSHESGAAALLDNARAVAGFAYYGLMCLVGVVSCWLVALLLRGPRRYAFCQQIVHRCLASWERVMERIGVFHVDFPEVATLRALRGTIIAPSHPSLIDAPHFLSRMPHLTCLMKKSVLKNPFYGYTARLAGYLPNDHGREFIRLGSAALRAGQNLLIFPEGTRTVETPVNPFKKGFALMATLADAPIQTVFVEMSYFYLGKRWKLRRSAVFPVQIKIRLGKTFRPQPGQSAKALGEEIEHYFRSMMVKNDSGRLSGDGSVVGSRAILE